MVTFAPASAQPPRGRRAEPGGAAGDERRGSLDLHGAGTYTL